MRRMKKFAVALAVGAVMAMSFSAAANWQGTWHYYNEEGALVGGWTAGCGDADGSWGVRTTNRHFVQGCGVAEF